MESVGVNLNTEGFIKVEWIPPEAGGRKSPPGGGEYFSVARFDEDKNWDGISWSIKFTLETPVLENNLLVSYGMAQFLFSSAPHNKLAGNNSFFIYEGAKKVAKVISMT